MLISVFSPKGGVGTSTVSALVSKAFSDIRSTLLLDVDGGDLNGIVGVDDYKFGFEDWAFSQQPNGDNLARISTLVNEKLSFVGSAGEFNVADIDEARSTQLVDILSSEQNVIVADCGNAEYATQQKIIDASDLKIVVFRQCYLGMLRASENKYCVDSDVCVVIKEGGRSIKTSQLANALKVPVVIEIDARIDFARTIDAGVLMSRTPEKMISSIRKYVADLDLAEEAMVEKDYSGFWHENENLDLRARFVLPEKYTSGKLSRLKGKS